jgi:catechol 2,3-dioxygenase-like lactoylglutathione lyase family enzyme
VDGILLPRPFKIVRLGPVKLFVENLEAAEAFYRDTLGFVVTEEVVWQGQRCVFLRCNTEHHSLALFPLALRDVLGLSTHSKCAAFGLQLANYRQLRDAVKFLREHDVEITEVIPTELHPGIDHAVHVLDPDGHSIQFYCAMEQIGWDGKPRPKELRRPRKLSEWPEVLENDSAYQGEPFFGPWG